MQQKDSGSPTQLFIAATACTCLSLYSLPERKRSDYVPPTEALGFGHVRRPRLFWIIEKFHQISKRKKRIKFIVPKLVNELPPKQRSNRLKERYPEDRVPEPKDLSFIRVSERIGRISEIDSHEESLCKRCLNGRKYNEKKHHLTISSYDSFSAYGLNLVVSLNLTDRSVDRNDICLFATDNLPELVGNVGLAVIVEDLLQSGFVHHTICHPIPSWWERYIEAEDTIWNIPLPYRAVNDKEGIDIADWANELRGDPVSVLAEEKDPRDRWDSLQLLLHYLGKGKTWAKADEEVKVKKQSEFENEGSVREKVYEKASRKAKRKRSEAGEDVEPGPIIRWGPSPESTRGDTDYPLQ
jgi:hypothetical protein